jgi:hypothetical protein
VVAFAWAGKISAATMANAVALVTVRIASLMVSSSLVIRLILIRHFLVFPYLHCLRGAD